MANMSVDLVLSGNTAVGTILNGDSSVRVVDIVREMALPDGSGWEPTVTVVEDLVVPGIASATFSNELEFGGTYRFRARLSDDPSFVTQWSQIRLTLSVTLGQSAPNPFVTGSGTQVTIPYSVAGAPLAPNQSRSISDYSEVRLEVFDVRGARVATLVDDIGFPGEGTARWSGLNDQGDPVASGVYFYRLSAAGKLLTRKMVLIRR
jgi:hypothetical protein